MAAYMYGTCAFFFQTCSDQVKTNLPYICSQVEWANWFQDKSDPQGVYIYIYI